ncbi:hypothetical protein V490_06486 [Pseudogymnoascus sp. VKM F-3557]|nr:hypothetical protein V490_06486 [Pseudogymnoascus sp. VKM F-3557]
MVPALCDKCIHFTVDYKFHTSAPIPLDRRLRHRVSYTHENRFFFKLPWQCNDLWPSLPRLQASFEAGCALCGVIRTKLLAGTKPSDPVEPDVEITIRADYGFEDQHQRKPTGVIFDYQVVGQSQRNRTPVQPTFVLAAPRGNPASRQFREVSSVHPLSLDNQARIKEWITECKTSHEYCKTKTPQALPTRLIDVQLANPRLVFTKGKTGTYAALSYCWGLSPSNPFSSMYTTTVATITFRMAGMHFPTLPLTLQHAILVTRALGLQYLWIDALCIIQDSASDIAHGIQAMDVVYGNAEVVICATRGTSSKSGFLAPRQDVQPLLTVPFIPCEGGDPGAYGFYDQESFPKRNDWHSVETSVWNKRAWTFQERVVPPRVLHFSPSSLRLECRTSDFSELECSPRQVVLGNSVLGNDYRYLGVLERLAAQEPRDKLEIYETYYKFASEYSIRVLSFEKDRQGAFAAVVKRFGELMEKEGLYGLWVEDIWRGLVWSVWGRRVGKADTPLKTNPSSKQAKSPWPSWSWYSSPNPISWIHSSKVFKSASPQSLLPQGNNSPVLISFTATLPSSMIISAVVREVEMEIPTGFAAYIVHGGERWGKVDLDAKFELSDKVQDQSTPPSPPPAPQKTKIWLLQLRNKYQIFNDRGGPTLCWAAGLVLSHVEKVGDCSSYRRIGIFDVYSQEKWEELFEGKKQTRIKLI